MSFTPYERRQLRMCLHGFYGSINLLWAYLAACLGRPLTEDEKTEIRAEYLGRRKP